MALELGLKLTRTRACDNATSVSELRISKNTAGPVFVSTETHSSFILTCYLKGYDRNSFQIKISEDGKEISISGEKPLQEMLMMGRVVLKKNVEIVGFRKDFKIPHGVVLDRIKAKFDEDESLLKIVMPKLVKGICGVQIEEVKKEGFGESSQKGSETEENENVLKNEGLSDEKLVESTKGDVTAETIRKEVESPRFEAMKEPEPGESADHIPKNIGEERLEVLKEPVLQPLEESENIMLDRPPGTTGEDKFEGTPKEEIGEVEFEHGGKDQERVPTEMSKKGLEAIETYKEGGESEKVFAGKFGFSGKDKAAVIEHGQIEGPKFGAEDRGEQGVEGILEETQKEETEETKFECEGKAEERVGAKIKEGVEAKDTAMEGRESEKVLVGNNGVSRRDKAAEAEHMEEPKFGIEDRVERMGKDILEGTQKKVTEETKDGERVGTKISKGGLEALDTTMEGREPEKVLDGAFGINGEDIIEGKQKREIEEAKFEREGKDEERVATEISKEGFEAIDTTMEGREPEKVLVGASGINGEEIIQGKQKKEIEETKFERKGKDEERVGTEISKGGLEGIDTTMEGRETEKVLVGAFGVRGEDILEGTQKKEIAETKFEREDKDKERVGREIIKGGLEAIDTKIEGRESKKLLAEAFGITGEDMFEGKQKKEIQETKFESEGRDEERVRKEISKGGLEAIDTTMEERESEKVLAGATVADWKGRIDENEQTEVEEVKLETEGKDEEREGRETTKEDSEAIETRMEGVEPKKLHGGKVKVSKEGVVKGMKQEETEDTNKERVKDIVGGTQKRENQMHESENGERGEERVGTETSKGGLEEIGTKTEGGESEMVLAASIGVSGEDMVEELKQRGSEVAKFESEGKDEEKVGRENGKKVLKAIESKMEGGESKNVGKIAVSEEDVVGGTEQRGVGETKFEIEDRDKEKVEEIFKGTQEKEIGKKEFANEGKDEERVGREIKEEFEAKDATIEGGVYEKLLSGAAGDSGKDIVEGTKRGEINVPKFVHESRDEEMLKEEISNEGFVARKTKIEESPMQEPKLPIQLEESEGTFQGIERGEDKSEGTKLKEIQEPKFQSVEENSKIPKCATSKGENLQETEEATEAMAKRQGREAEGILEKIEGEEPKKMSKEASKVNGNDNARDSGRKKIEESSIRSPRDGHVQENMVSKVFEELGTDTAKFPKQMSGTKAQREKEVKVKEEIIVKREKEVKVKEEIIVKREKEVKVKEVIVNEAKEGSEKATTGDRIQLETGHPSDGRGFNEEILEAAKWDKTKALKEGSVETEPSLEKVKGESDDNLQSAVFSPLLKDTNKRERMERTQKETEYPKAQHRVQELPMKIAESKDEKERPRDTKTEEMKEAKIKSEETQDVADEESATEKKIQEAEIERVGKTNLFEKDLQEVPEEKYRQALGKGMRERESMLSTEQTEVKEIDKVCEECKRPAAYLEREKWRTSQNVEDEKLRRENALKQVAESMQKAPEKEHPGKSEVEEEVKHLEEKVAYPELRKEVETKNEVEGSRLKELPPPKVKVQSLEALESEKKNMKWKSPKNKKLMPETGEGEDYEASKPPEVKGSSSTQQSMVDRQKSEIDFPKSNTSRTPTEEKEIEALQPNVPSDQNLEGEEHFKTLTEDRGHYLLEKEKLLETKKVAEEEKLNQKDKEHNMKRNGSEKINQIKGVAEEFKEVLADNETEQSQGILLPQTTEIYSNEKIPEIQEVQQEKRRKIPFHANEESEAVISNREVESQKPNAAHPKELSIKFSNDKPKAEVDKLQGKKSLSPSVEKLSKGPSNRSRPGVKEDAPTVENSPQFQEGTKASETVANELDKPPAEKLEVAEEGKIDECRDGGHLELEFQEPEKQESELDFLESTRRRSDQEDEETHFSQQEENHEDHAIEEEKAGEAENVTKVEISQESSDLEDIEVEASEMKVELCAPLVVAAGSVFIASLIIFFFGHKRIG